MLEFLASQGTPTIVVATKVDKLRNAERAQHLAVLVGAAGIEADQLIPFSAVTGEGRDELAEAIVHLITPHEPLP
jgi:GTP-binding protein